MIAAFIPKRFVIDGKLIKYVDIRGVWGDGTIGIDCYYERNHAKFMRLEQEQLEKIDGYHETKVETDKAVDLYNSIFN